MNETEVRTIELYSDGDVLLSSSSVETVEDIKDALSEIATLAMPNDVIKFK